MRIGWVGMGPETLLFEGELSAMVGAGEGHGEPRVGLFLALLVHGVRAGNEVIYPSLTWCSAANAALYLGAKPVFCDVDSQTCCITPDTVAEELAPRTKAVIEVHLEVWR